MSPALIKAAAVVGALLFFARRAGAAPWEWFSVGEPMLRCDPGATFVAMTVEEGQARFGRFAAWPLIEDQIKTYGGTCLRSGGVELEGTRPVDETLRDTGPITRPSQLPDW